MYDLTVDIFCTKVNISNPQLDFGLVKVRN